MHEGIGERKRKACPIPLNWDRLLPCSDSDDEPPPEVVIQEAAEISKPSVAVMMEREGDESQMEEYLRKIPEKELIEKISRIRSSFGPMSSNLPDGGEKLGARLKRLEGELERRKLLKDDNKCKMVTPLAYDSTCHGATFALSARESQPYMPASEFALRFCNKLDDEKATKCFGEELSTLNCSGRKNMSEHAPFSAQTRNIGLSSRQTPFKSPTHLSAIDIPPQSNDEQCGSQFSNASPHPSDKDSSGCSSKKESASRGRSPLNSRRNNWKNVVLVDEEELEVEVVDKADHRASQSVETCIYYPSRDDPEAIEICYSDMECLAPESYLSSPIMNFYIQYLQKPPSSMARRRHDYHFFNTYFYEKLKQDVLTKTDKESSFLKFRRWWRGVNIFEKAYIFLPIHENLHWSLVIICIPNKEDESGPIILHLDSLGLHISKSIFSNVKSFLIEEWKILRQEEVLPELPIPDNIWDKLSRRIGEKIIEVPQQRNEYDCGIFVLFFMERFIEEAPQRLKKDDLDMFGRQWFKPEEASSLRRKIRNLLNEEFKNANPGTCKLDS